MGQLGLFERGDDVLTDGPLGRVTYTPNLIDAARAAAWFDELRERVEWRSERRMMYEREVDVPRLVAGFRLDDANLLAPLREADAAVRAATGVTFSSVGLNFYRDGRDSVAPHNDHLNELRKDKPIALISLGSTRRMTIRAKAPPRRVLHVDLEPGSLLVMSYETQLHYDHGIPKTDESVGPRISLAFRVRVPSDGRANFYR
jgi:alkylated DNA repair dioxygenase AlkB